MTSAGDVRASFVGVLSKRGRFTVVEPLFEPGHRVTIDTRGRSDVQLGAMVLVRVGRGGRPRVVRALGRPDRARDVVEALLVDRGHARTFAPPVEQQAQDAVRRPDAQRRSDLTALPTFTIDPAAAKDYDDAISLEHEGGASRLYVHIADVAAHVDAGSPIDAEARSRGNSVYVPGTVEPMLPHALSSDACSLLPGVPRRTVTVECHLDGGGNVRSTSFYRSLIHSDACLTYDDVDLIFDGRASPPETVREPLARARALAAALRERRLGRGALGLETSEPEFSFDSEGHVVRAIDDVQTEAHGVIEELMLLANEQIASELARRRTPTLYRVHERPDSEAIERLLAQLESLDVPTPPVPDRITPEQAVELVGAIGARVADHVRRNGGRGRIALTSLVLRSLKQAYYSPRNVGHAGLASAAYCHFTSPIRRYPDLVVHRSLLAAVGADELPPMTQELSELGAHCSKTEREAMQVERSADDICLAFLLERLLDQQDRDREFEGEVSGVISAGAFVSFAVGGENTAPCEGFLPARRLRGDYFELNEEATALVGRRTAGRLRLADPITVLVRSVDPPRGRVDLAPVGDFAGS